MASAIPIGLSVASSVLSAKGKLDQGKEAERAGRIEAEQREIRAGQIEEIGERDAAEIRRQGKRVGSNARAARAAGGGAFDAGAAERLAKIKTDTDYQALSAIYDAQLAADDERRAGAEARRRGRVARKSSRVAALGSVLSGGASVYRQGKDAKWWG